MYMTAHSEQSTTTAIDELRSGPPTLSVGQAAAYLGVSRAYGYEMAREGRLPVIKLGSRRVRVPTAALIKMLGADA
ncbi:DNA-binding protein [Gordonia sp. i37]|nr:helix-turn-helix domain-containing protein [Gordonia sp. i37]OPX14330.1 DNA-binding protein [Gordonia sp. i37]